MTSIRVAFDARLGDASRFSIPMIVARCRRKTGMIWPMVLSLASIRSRCRERSLFMLEWLRDLSLRLRVKIGLERG